VSTGMDLKHLRLQVVSGYEHGNNPIESKITIDYYAWKIGNYTQYPLKGFFIAGAVCSNGFVMVVL